MKKITVCFTLFTMLALSACGTSYLKKEQLPKEIKYYAAADQVTFAYTPEFWLNTPQECSDGSDFASLDKFKGKTIKVIGELTVKACEKGKPLTYVVGELEGYGYLFVEKTSMLALKSFREKK